MATYSSRTSYDAATTGNTVIDFADFVPAGQVLGNFSTAAGLMTDGVTFVGPTSDGSHGGYFLYAVAPDYFSSYQGFNGNPTSLQGPSGGTTYPGVTNITLPAGTTAFAFDAFIANNILGTGGDGVLDVTVNGVTYPVVSPPKPNLGFIGFTSDTPISSIQVVGMGPEIFPDLVNFTIGTAVPEPAAGFLLLIGCAAAPRPRRRLSLVAQQSARGFPVVPIAQTETSDAESDWRSASVRFHM